MDDNEIVKPQGRVGIRSMFRRVYNMFAPRAHTVIIFAALIFTLGAKFSHSWRFGGIHEYGIWILPDLAFLLGAELVLALICIRWPFAWVLRFSTLLASLITTWAVINAAWLVRNGTQILPASIMPLFRDPLSNFPIVGTNLYKHPWTAILLLVPSFILLGMMIRVVVKPVKPNYSRRLLWGRFGTTLLILVLVVPVRASFMNQRPSEPATSGLLFSCHIKAITSLIKADSSPLTREDFINAQRSIPAPNQVTVSGSHDKPLNLVIIILEGVQHRYTSLDKGDLTRTPYLYKMAEQGVFYSSMRSVLTHTTKAIFSIMTGRYPSGSQDVVEAIPVMKGYASLASLLKQHGGYRTQFMQSAKGNFESRPGLVKNLGFETFFAREDLNDPNTHIGYLAADEFAMLPSIGQWLDKVQDQPFFLTILCSTSHDPYIVPEWYAEPAKDPVDRYQQVITYTDRYIQSVDAELRRRNLADYTVFCVVGDHGEGFGEHGKLGHDRIGFEEVLRIPWVIRSPQGIQPGTRIDSPVSSIDVAPTLLALLGFDPAPAMFDGLNSLDTIPDDRKVFFSGWAPEGAAGYIQGQRKYIHNPAVDEIVAYDLSNDPLELASQALPETEAQAVIQTMIQWRKKTIFRPDQANKGWMQLYDTWLCRWAGRSPVTKYQGVYQ